MKKKWIVIIAILVVLALLATVIVFAVVPRPEEDESETVLGFAEFLAMSPAEQQAYMESYEDITDFLEWYREAEEKYQSEQSDIIIDGDNIDIGDYID